MEHGPRIVMLSAATSVLVSTLILAAGTTALKRDTLDTTSTPPTESLTNLEHIVREESPIIEAVQQSEPSVVSVVISKDLPVLERSFETVPFGNGFNIRIPQTRERGTQLQEVGGGTAFFVTNDGLLLTNKHVVRDEHAHYSILLNDGRTLEAQVAARDSITDIALLKVQGSDFPLLQLATDDEPTLGQSVIAIGNALAEFRNTVSVGVVSGLQRTITAGSSMGGSLERLSRIIQTDAAINEGNSGGPLLNLHGEVIGMNTAVATGAQNIGFAIPVNDLKRAVESYRQYGRIVRPLLGVHYSPLTADLAKEKRLTYDHGVLVASDPDTHEPAIVEGSPADKAGIKDGDVILEADGQKLTETTDLATIVQYKQPGDSVRLRIVHDGKERELTVKLEEWTQ